MVLKNKILLALAAASILSVSGCGKKEELAEINGRPVTKAEFSAYMKFKRIPEGDPNVLSKQLDRYLERNALADVIASQDLPEKDVLAAELQDFKNEMYISRYFENYLKKTVTEDAIKNYYTTNADSYAEEKAKVAHILIRTRPGMSETERKAVLTKAMEIHSLVRTGKKTFDKAAEEYSEDKVSSKKGGDLGWIRKGSIDPAFSKAAFETLKKDEMSEPVETAFGYHIIRLSETPAKTQKPLEAVSGEIRHMLRSQAQEAEMKKLMEKVKIKKFGAEAKAEKSEKPVKDKGTEAEKK